MSRDNLTIKPNRVLILPIKSQDIAHQFAGTGSKIGVLVAGNAGRPGGSLGKPDGSGLSGSFSRDWPTQEESVVASWLHAEEHKWYKDENKRNRHNRRYKIKEFPKDEVFRKNLGDLVPNPHGYSKYERPWGMQNPYGDENDTQTLQKANLRRPFHDYYGIPRTQESKNYDFAYLAHLIYSVKRLCLH